HGLILSEQYPDLLPALLKSMDDSVVQVSFKATLSAGQFSGEQVVSALARIIEKRGQDPWFRTAVLSAPSGSSLDLLNNLIKQHSFLEKAETWRKSFLEDFSFVTGAANKPKDIAALLDILSRPAMGEWREAGLKGLTTALKKHEVSDPALKETLLGISTTSDKDIQVGIERLRKAYSTRSGL
ncbi:MAG: hypothetical protein ABIR06_19765, partial [Cyclobacteriaceae bacterium]